MSTATLLSEREGTVPSSGAHSVKKHYRLDPPYEGENGAIEYVIASSVDRAFDTGEAETMVFEANKDGEIEDFLDLAVVQGRVDHEQAIVNLGYEVAA